jgi:hypothetical protein
MISSASSEHCSKSKVFYHFYYQIDHLIIKPGEQKTIQAGRTIVEIKTLEEEKIEIPQEISIKQENEFEGLFNYLEEIRSSE